MRYTLHAIKSFQHCGIEKFFKTGIIGIITGGKMTRMFNPPHPGKMLREFLGEMDVTSAAKKLHISRTTLSRILNCNAGISADMSLRLSDALGTHDSLWYEMQMGYDMWQASQKKRPKIERFHIAA